ncbi:restriction endonuclease subunit S [Mucilaginibacter phyllosphaerae]|uniref:Type I restriction enzyme S subunit n=3 Tax=Mucilaginibacter phyllosphaerae TaxID=1812349 RepID=A0ABR6I8Z6_9SPHI|nr:restriction endonuclease subunit S [Mucilaginibacter phyllosphaerae]MBB3969514.1 type I restriction enzyme S subunit [Mucilaginibacter phyllosphaerae]
MAIRKDDIRVPNLRFPGFEGEWEQRNLKELFTIGSGRDYKHLSNGDVPVFGTGGLMTYVNEFLYDGESVCIGRKGTINKPYYHKGKFWTVDTLFYTHSFKKALPKFVYYIFQKIDWLKYNEASGVPSLSKSTIEKIEVYIPKKDEQEKLMGLLSALDGRIQTQNKIIEELQTLMQILTKEIFSRKLRFKKADENVFPEWDKTKMGDVFEFKVTNSYSREKLNYSEGIIKNIHYGDIHTQYRTLFNVEKEHTPYINLEVNTNSINKESYCQVGDLILADASEDLKDVGKSIEIVNLKDQKTLSGLHTILARPLKNIFAIGFCGYLFRSEKVRQQIQKEAHGSKVLSIAPVRLSKLTLPIPTLIEQTLIVDFLFSIDEKIEIEKVLLKKYHVQKQYLLQNLFI